MELYQFLNFVDKLLFYRKPALRVHSVVKQQKKSIRKLMFPHLFFIGE